MKLFSSGGKNTHKVVMVTTLVVVTTGRKMEKDTHTGSDICMVSRDQGQTIEHTVVNQFRFVASLMLQKFVFAISLFSFGDLSVSKTHHIT